MDAARRTAWAGAVPRLLTVLCLGAIALSGCSSTDQQASSSPTPVASVASVAQAAQAAQAALASARPAAPTAASAMAYLTTFWDSYNLAYATYDTGPLRTLSDPGCSVCAEVASDVEALSSAGIRVSGHEVRVSGVQPPSGDPATGPVTVEALITRSDGVALGPDGDRTELPGFGLRHSTTTLTFRAGGWHVGAITTRSL